MRYRISEWVFVITSALLGASLSSCKARSFHQVKAESPDTANPTSPGFYDLPSYLNWLEHAKPQSVEDVLLAASVELKQNYQLIFASESSQTGTVEFPRIIMHRKDASLILAVSGQTGDEDRSAGVKTVEAIGFDEKTSAFQFVSADFSNATPTIETNPQKCQTCHTKALRPNWDTYPRWPGAFGAESKLFGTRSGPNFKKWKGAEDKLWDEFGKAQSTNSTTQNFHIFKPGTRYAYLDSKKHGRYSASWRSNLSSGFTRALAALNYRRIAREIDVAADLYAQSTASTDVEKTKALIFAAFDPIGLSYEYHTKFPTRKKIKLEDSDVKDMRIALLAKIDSQKLTDAVKLGVTSHANQVRIRFQNMLRSAKVLESDVALTPKDILRYDELGGFGEEGKTLDEESVGIVSHRVAIGEALGIDTTTWSMAPLKRSALSGTLSSRCASGCAMSGASFAFMTPGLGFEEFGKYAFGNKDPIDGYYSRTGL